MEKKEKIRKLSSKQLITSVLRNYFEVALLGTLQQDSESNGHCFVLSKILALKKSTSKFYYYLQVFEVTLFVFSFFLSHQSSPLMALTRNWMSAVFILARPLTQREVPFYRNQYFYTNHVTNGKVKQLYNMKWVIDNNIPTENYYL